MERLLRYFVTYEKFTSVNIVHFTKIHKKCQMNFSQVFLARSEPEIAAWDHAILYNAYEKLLFRTILRTFRIL